MRREELKIKLLRLKLDTLGWGLFLNREVKKECLWYKNLAKKIFIKKAHLCVHQPILYQWGA